MTWKIRRLSSVPPPILFSPSFSLDVSSYGVLLSDASSVALTACVDVASSATVNGVWISLGLEIFDSLRLCHAQCSPLVAALEAASAVDHSLLCVVFYRDLKDFDGPIALAFFEAQPLARVKALTDVVVKTSSVDDKVLEALQRQQVEIEQLQTKLTAVMELLESSSRRRCGVESSNALRRSSSFEARYENLRQSFATSRIRSPSSSSAWTATDDEKMETGGLRASVLGASEVRTLLRSSQTAIDRRSSMASSQTSKLRWSRASEWPEDSDEEDEVTRRILSKYLRN
jgi:hypothetical protein